MPPLRLQRLVECMTRHNEAVLAARVLFVPLSFLMHLYIVCI